MELVPTEFEIERFLPAFLLREATGRAMAKAVEAAVRAVLRAAAQGVACLTDVSAMPEWRLDEMAWETGILYDDSADIETKRAWVAGAMETFALYGTAAGIERMLTAAYDSARVEEWFDYDGEPGHFRVSVSGEWSAEANAWAYAVIERAKNVRSTLDTITFSALRSTAALNAAAAVGGMEITATSREREDET